MVDLSAKAATVPTLISELERGDKRRLTRPHLNKLSLSGGGFEFWEVVEVGSKLFCKNSISGKKRY